MSISRRGFLATTMMASLFQAGTPAHAQRASGTPQNRIPVIDITDLYHPAQDPGDNFDLIAAYALPEIDLKAVILDCTDRYRRPYVNKTNPAYDDPAGKRDPGFIPVTQLNAIFGRDIACAVGPFTPMKHPEDRMEDIPFFQQTGVELLMKTLHESPVPVDVVSFGSARPLAVAYNRNPKLLRKKIRRAHLCAGSAPAGFIEWNVQLDPHAFVRVLRSDLPLAIYPCGTEKDAWGLGTNNTFWRLPNLAFIRDMTPALQRYLVYAFEASKRIDFLAALEEEVPKEVMDRVAARDHCVWETAVWMQVSNRRLVHRAEGSHRLIPATEIIASDTVLSNELRPCTLSVRDDGSFDFRDVKYKYARCAIYHRQNPEENQRALQEALPALYTSFRV